MKVVSMKETRKRIFVDDQFVSMFRSILVSPIFNVKNKNVNINFLEKNYANYKEVECKGEVLNLTFDFPFFIFINKVRNETGDNLVKFNANDFYDFQDPKGNKSRSNRNAKTFQKVISSLKRMKTINLFIKDNLNNHVGTSLIGDFTYDENTKDVTVEIKPAFLQFYEIDCNNIQNIDFSIYNSLSKEYSKALYLYYISNNMFVENIIYTDVLKKRFLATGMEDKRFNPLIKEAHEELASKKIGFIVSVKENCFSRKLISYNIQIATPNKGRRFDVLPEPKPRKEKPKPKPKQEEEECDNFPA